MVVKSRKLRESNSLRRNTRKIVLNKCSPRKNKETVTCFSKPSLKRIIKYWNDYYPNDKIEIATFDTKHDLWKKINTKLARMCDNEYCWLSQPFISNKDEINGDFKPKKPLSWKSNKNEWLTTSDIEKVMNQYTNKHPDFTFVGAVPIDFDKEMHPGMCVVNELCKIKLASLLKKGINKIGIVFNLDPHDEPGSHWVSFFGNLTTGNLNYFDSYGFKPPNEVKMLVKRLISQGKENNIKMKYDYNKIRHQYKDSECGVYSINFIENMLDGKTFKSFCQRKIPDDHMEKFRNKYFI